MIKAKGKKDKKSTREVSSSREIRSSDEYGKFYFPKKTSDAEIVRVDEKDPYHLGVTLLEKSLKPFLK